MKQLLRDAAIAAAAIAAGLALPSLRSLLAQPATSSPVSVTLVAPAAGSTLSNIITLSAEASSTAAPISRVEFYDTYNGVTTLIATVTNFAIRPLPPTGLRVTAP